MTDVGNRRVAGPLIALPWLWVAVPLAYGVWQLVTKAIQVFST